MLNILAQTFRTATRTEDRDRPLTRVRDVQNWDAPGWWSGRTKRGKTRYIDLDRL